MIKKVLYYCNLIAIAILAFSCSANNNTIKLSNNIITKEINITNFSKINLEGVPKIVYTTGAPAIKIVAPDNIIEYVKVVVENKTLKVSIKDNKSISFSNNHNIMIYASSSSLDDVALLGSGDVIIKSPIDCNNLKVKLTGSGDIAVWKDIVCKNKAKISLLGSGDIKMHSAITADNVTVSLNGSGDISTQKIISKNIETSVSGSGDIEVKGAQSTDVNVSVNGSGEIKIDNIQAQGVSSSVFGSGDISLNGNTDTFIFKVNSSGTIKASQLSALKGSANLLGSGSIDCNVSKTLISSINGSGNIYYRGNPTITSDTKKYPKRKN